MTDYRAEIEFDYSWRASEVEFIHNLIENTRDEGEKARIRRFGVVMLYAHYEGFTKFALGVYIRKINDAELSIADVKLKIAAASMNKLFGELRDPNRKSSFFSTHKLDPDTDKFAREYEFISGFENKLQEKVFIDDAFLTGVANLTPTLLKQFLFRLDLDASHMTRLEGKIDKLLYNRHSIAHGSSSGVAEERYEKIYSTYNEVMMLIKSEAIKAIREDKFKR